MNRDETLSETFSGNAEVPYVSSIIALACVTVAAWIDWVRISRETRALHVHLTLVGTPSRTVAGIPRRSDTIEHIAPATDRLEQVVGVAYPHQITRNVGGHLGVERF